MLNASAGIRTRVNWLEASYTATILPTPRYIISNKLFLKFVLFQKVNAREGFYFQSVNFGFALIKFSVVCLRQKISFEFCTGFNLKVQPFVEIRPGQDSNLRPIPQEGIALIQAELLGHIANYFEVWISRPRCYAKDNLLSFPESGIEPSYSGMKY